MGMIKIKTEVIKNWMACKNPPWTYEDLAKKAGISKSLLEKIMIELRHCTDTTMMTLCDATGLDIPDLFFYDKEANYKEGVNR